MNPQDLLARQVMMARLTGTPVPAASQMADGSPVQAPAPEVPAENPSPVGDRQLGDMAKRTASPEEKLAKAAMEGAAHQDPHVQALSKVLLAKLIPYLGATQQAP